MISIRGENLDKKLLQKYLLMSRSSQAQFFQRDNKELRKLLRRNIVGLFYLDKLQTKLDSFLSGVPLLDYYLAESLLSVICRRESLGYTLFDTRYDACVIWIFLNPV